MEENTKKKVRKRKAQISIRLPPELKSELEALAEKQMRTFARQLELAVREHISREREKERREALAGGYTVTE